MSNYKKAFKQLNESKYLFIAYGFGFQSGVGLTDWNYAWEIQDE